MRKPVIGVPLGKQQQRIREILVRMLINRDGDMVDVTEPEWVQVEISQDGTVMWVHVNGITLFRACRIIHHPVEIKDNRRKRKRNVGSD